MVITGDPRGNGKQLAWYLMAMKDNDAIRLFEMNGDLEPDASLLKLTLHSMNLTSELSNSDKGLYHAQISPAPGEDKKMSDEHWLQAAEILGKELNLHEQRRVIVLHTKHGRTHAHVVWERFDLEKGIMISDSFSRLAQDRARKEMERVFEHAATPHRNKHRPELKTALTEIWGNTTTGQQFIKSAKSKGYLISEGTGRNPYMVVDENARSYNLARQIKGVRLNEIRQRLRNEKLLSEKDAIELAKASANSERGKSKQENDQERFKKVAAAFADTRDDMLEDTKQKDVFKEKFVKFVENDPTAKPTPKPQPDKLEQAKETAKQFQKTKEDMVQQPEPETPINKDLQENKQDQTKDVDPRRLAMRKRLQEIEEEKQKNKDKGYGLG